MNENDRAQLDALYAKMNKVQKQAWESNKEERETILLQITLEDLARQRKVGNINLLLAIIGIVVGASATIYAAKLSRNDNKEYVSSKFLKDNFISKKQHDKETMELLDHIYSDSLILRSGK